MKHKKFIKYHAVLAVLCMVATLFVAPEKPAFAGVTEIQAFQFGDMVVTNNDSVHTVTVTVGGSTSYSAGLIPIGTVPAQQGIYDIDGLDPMLTISSITVTQLTPFGGPSGGSNFNIGTFQTTFTPISPGGVSRVNLGATASTTGTGIPYVDQTYATSIQLSFNF